MFKVKGCDPLSNVKLNWETGQVQRAKSQWWQLIMLKNKNKISGSVNTQADCENWGNYAEEDYNNRIVLFFYSSGIKIFPLSGC